MKNLYKHYNKYLPMAREQKKFIENTFTKKAISKQYEDVLSIVQKSIDKLPQMQSLQLPKLDLPKLKSVTDKPKLPELKLPKLNKV